MAKTTKVGKIKIEKNTEKRQFSTGAKRQFAKGKGTPVLFPPEAMIALAKHFEGGAEIYGPRNWEKGLPLSEIMSSALRHGFQEMTGLIDENHAVAFFWNACIYVATKIRIERGLLPKELNDMPSYVPRQCPLHPKYRPSKLPKNKCEICTLVYENRREK